MATIVVTTSNWNDPTFWSGLTTSNGDTLDLSALGSDFELNFRPDGENIEITNNGVTFSIGDAGMAGQDVNLGSGVVSHFDTIIAPDASNFANFGSEDQTYTGGTGDDTVFAGAGDDTVYGGDGNDSIGSSFGDDNVDAGAGDDIIRDREGNDTIQAGIGDDTVLAGDGNDTIDLGAGNDLYDAHTTTVTIGTSTVEGGDGSDYFISGQKNDHLSGGADDDTFVIHDSFGNDTIIGGETGGDDILDLSNLTGSVTLSYDADDPQSGNIADGNGNTIEFSEIEQIILSDQADTLDATAISTGGAGIDIDAADGDDQITGGAGNDTIDAGAGSDTISGGAGDDSIYSGADDTRDTIFLSEGNDTIIGDLGSHSSRDDFIEFSSATSDLTVTWSSQTDGTIQMGADTTSFSQIGFLSAGSSASTTGGTNDLFDAQAADGYVLVYDYLGGADTFLGSAYGDVFVSDGSNSLRTDGTYVSVGDGDDYVEITAGAVTIIGGQGADTIIVSGAGSDANIDGGTDDDVIVTDVGEDTVDGGTGDDIILTYQNADLIVLRDNFGNDIIDGGEWGDDNDTINLNALTGGVVVTYDANDAEAGSIANVDGDTLSFSDIEQIILTDLVDTVDTSALSSAGSGVGIDAAGGNDTITGGAGNDTISGGDGDDLISGGDGDDFLRTGLGRDTLFGGSGNDTLMNSDGDDSLDGGAGDDSIVATGGNDTLRGGTGNDTMDGGEDADTFIIEDGFGNDSIIGGETTTTGVDQDVIDLTAVTSPVTVTFSDSEDGTITDGTHTITFVEIERFLLTDLADFVDATADSVGTYIEAGDGDDRLIGGTGDDTLFGGDGDDEISDSEGDDVVYAGAGSDTIGGWLGNDTLHGESGADYIEGCNGDDSITGGSGDDFLVGYDADGLVLRSTDIAVDDGSADTIEGGTGSDTIAGGGGADSLDGGDDADLFIFHNSFGADTVIGGEGGIDEDVLDFSIATTSVTVTYSGDEAGTVTDGSDTLDFSEIETLILTDVADVVDAAADTVGVDIDAAGGDDTVTGGSSDDRIEGGTGDDSITGGGGDDIFTYQAGDGADTITDFNAGNSGSFTDGDSTNNDFIDLTSFYGNIYDLRADFEDDGVLNQSNSTDNGGDVDYSGYSRFSSGEGIAFQNVSDRQDFTEDNTGVVCFTAGTLIATPDGEMPIEQLRSGDLVLTRDNGPQRLIWVASRSLTQTDLAVMPNLKPIVIAPQLVGAHSPLRVSPQHGVLMQLDGTEKLIRATHLAKMRGGQARVAAGCRQVTYYHFLFEDHQIVFANGAPSESFYPGTQAMRALNPIARGELLKLFPDLVRTDTEAAFGLRARSVERRCELPPTLRALSMA